MSTVRRRLALLPALLLVFSGIAACGDDDGADVRNIGEDSGSGSGSVGGSGSGSGPGSGSGSGPASG